MAPGVNLWAVKVCNECGGTCFTSDILEGIDWCVLQSQTRGGKWIINQSLGGGINNVWDNANRDARSKGVIMVTSAGNGNSNACNGFSMKF